MSPKQLVVAPQYIPVQMHGDSTFPSSEDMVFVVSFLLLPCPLLVLLLYAREGVNCRPRLGTLVAMIDGGLVFLLFLVDGALVIRFLTSLETSVLVAVVVLLNLLLFVNEELYTGFGVSVLSDFFLLLVVFIAVVLKSSG